MAEEKKTTKKTNTKKETKEKVVKKKEAVKKETVSKEKKPKISKSTKKEVKKTTDEIKDTDVKIANLDVTKDIKEDTKELKEITKSETKAVPNSSKTLILVIVLLAIALIISVVINTKSTKRTYILNEIFTDYGNTESITLPTNHYLTEDGQIMYIDGNLIKVAGAVYAYEDVDNTYDEMIEYYGSSSELENVTVGTKEYTKLTQAYEGGNLNCYFCKTDTHVLEVVLLNMEYQNELDILNTIK